MRKFLLTFVYFSLFLISFLFIAQKSHAGNPPVATQSAFVATTTGSDKVPADGVTIASMTATLKDYLGNPKSGDSVSLTAPSDGTAKFLPTSATLNAQGIATFSATSTQAGVDPITVTDLTTSTNLVALGNITFTATTPTPTPTSGPTPTPTPVSNICSGNTTDPPDPPNLYAVTATQNSATLYFVQPQKAFSFFTISYGLTSTADTYAVILNQGPTSGAITYQVNSLTTGQTYYFKVRATNGCAPGNWSKILSSLIGTSNPTATPSGSMIMGAGINIFAIIAAIGGVSMLTGFALMTLL